MTKIKTFQLKSQKDLIFFIFGILSDTRCMLFLEIKSLMAKEFRLELRQKYVVNGILLYLISTVFVAYLAFEGVISPELWNSLFWIILLFVAVNGISKSFLQESSARYLYYYTLVSPQAIVVSKILYNMLLMLLLSCVSLGLFILFMGYPLVDFPLFLFSLILGSMGLSSMLTMIAAIASRASQNFSLIAILSFPIVLPLLLTLMEVSSAALGNVHAEGGTGLIFILISIDLGVIILAYVLFPYLWRD